MTRFIDRYRDEYGVESICAVLDFSSSTYYEAKKRVGKPCARKQSDEELIPQIRRAWEEGKRLYGARKVWQALLRQGVKVARCTVERLMRQQGMHGAVAKPARPRTTVPGNDADRCRELVDREFRAPAPNQLWVVDITYVPLEGGGFCYTAFVTDAFSRAIAGWQVLDTLRTELALDALNMALATRSKHLSKALVHHGDRGVQYTSIAYGQRLAEAGIESSVGRVGDSYDNALAESVNALYKKEMVCQRDSWGSVEEVRSGTAGWVSWYNNERLHSWCAYVRPAEFEQAFLDGRIRVLKYGRIKPDTAA